MNNGYAICLNEWIEDEHIKTELRLLLKISSLTAEKGYCWGSNNYLAEYFKTTTVTISKQIKKLENLGYLDIEYVRRGAEIQKRIIRLIDPTIKENFNRTIKENFNRTIKENFKDNSISNNSISNNKEKNKKKKKTVDNLITSLQPQTVSNKITKQVNRPHTALFSKYSLLYDLDHMTPETREEDLKQFKATGCFDTHTIFAYERYTEKWLIDLKDKYYKCVYASYNHDNFLQFQKFYQSNDCLLFGFWLAITNHYLFGRDRDCKWFESERGHTMIRKKAQSLGITPNECLAAYYAYLRGNPNAKAVHHAHQNKINNHDVQGIELKEKTVFNMSPRNFMSLTNDEAEHWINEDDLVAGMNRFREIVKFGGVMTAWNDYCMDFLGGIVFADKHNLYLEQ